MFLGAAKRDFSIEFTKMSMARLGELNVTSVSAITTLVDDRKELREFLKDALGLDKASGYTHTLEAGRVIQVWEQACKRTEVETQKDAERRAANLPPQLSEDDVYLLKKMYEKQCVGALELSRPYACSQPPRSLGRTGWTRSSTPGLRSSTSSWRSRAST